MARASGDDANSNENMAVARSEGYISAQSAPAPAAPLPERGLRHAGHAEAPPSTNAPIQVQQPPPPTQQSYAPSQQWHANPTQTVNVHVNTPVMPMVITAPAGPPFIVRALWYLFVGWWLSAIVIVLGYLCMLTIIGIPVAFALFNRLPQALTLRPRTMQYGVEMRDGVAYLKAATIQQRPWFLRAIYFVLIGWWLGAIWLVAAWFIGLFIITLPITFLMYNRTSGIMTLQRH